MSVELDGNVRMRGETGPGVTVRVIAEDGRLRLVMGNELVGDWQVSAIGVSALQDGFTIKAEGEEFLLRTEDDVAFAEEIGVAAASPRLARRLAARNNPEEPETVEPAPIASNLAAIGFAVAGALIVLGGTFLNISGEDAAGDDFWLAFVIGGVVMIGVAYVMSMGSRLARLVALLVTLALVVVFGYAVAQRVSGTSQLTAYGFIAGGLVVGVAVLFSGGLPEPD